MWILAGGKETPVMPACGEGGWSTWEKGVGVPGRGGLEYLGEGVGVPGRGGLEYTPPPDVVPLATSLPSL